MTDFPLTNEEIFEAFSETLGEYQGKILRVYQHEYFLTIRSLIPVDGKVAKGDSFRQGVALRANWDSIEVCPFVHREVCQNGTIVPIGFSRVSTDRNEDKDWAIVQLKKGLMQCFHPATFAESLHQFKESTTRPLPGEFNLVEFLSKNKMRMSRRKLERFAELLRQEERNDYGLMNALTALARDEKDPFFRWDLELLGGQVGIDEAEMPITFVVEESTYKAAWA